MSNDVGLGPDHSDQSGDDARQAQAADRLEEIFRENPETVFYGRQLEVLLEREFFHWITNRALRSLEGSAIRLESHPLANASPTTLAWNRRYRYPKRQISAVLDLINRYANPDVSRAIGDRGEDLVLDGFAANSHFTCLGRDVSSLDGSSWTRTGHNLDFVFERDGQRYGVEVKNTLGYLDKGEFDTKSELAEHLGLTPVFVCRALPKSWIWELNRRGGFALILRWQLYPPLLRELAEEMRSRFQLPIDTPRRLQDGTVKRFIDWHVARL